MIPLKYYPPAPRIGIHAGGRAYRSRVPGPLVSMGIFDGICPFPSIFLTLSKNAYTEFYAGPDFMLGKIHQK